MGGKKSQINRKLFTTEKSVPLPEKVRLVIGNEFEPRMVQLFGSKEQWSQELTDYWEMFKLAALQSAAPAVEFYNESNEKDDLL